MHLARNVKDHKTSFDKTKEVMSEFHVRLLGSYPYFLSISSMIATTLTKSGYHHSGRRKVDLTHVSTHFLCILKQRELVAEIFRDRFGACVEWNVPGSSLVLPTNFVNTIFLVMYAFALLFYPLFSNKGL